LDDFQKIATHTNFRWTYT